MKDANLTFGRPGGARITYSRDGWDSAVLGLDAYRVLGVRGPARGRPGVLGRFTAGLARRKGVYAVARVPARENALAQDLQKAGFLLVNSMLEFSAPVPRKAAPAGGVRPFRPGDEPGVLAVTRGILKYARFRFQDDPRLPRRAADGAVLAWARNCCRGLRGDAVLVRTCAGRVAGFVACQAFPSAGTGNIDLLAVGRDFQGRDFGRDLVKAAMAWFAAKGLGRATVATSSSNPQAVNFYLTSGFRLDKVSVTLGFHA